MGCAQSSVALTAEEERMVAQHAVPHAMGNKVVSLFTRADASGFGRATLQQVADALGERVSPTLRLAVTPATPRGLEAAFVWVTRAQFLDAMLLLCSRDAAALASFSFAVIDERRRGRVDKSDVRAYLNELERLGHMGVPEMRAMLAAEASPSFSPATMGLFVEHCPLLYYPAARLQTKLRRRWGGERAWLKHVASMPARRFSLTGAKVVAAIDGRHRRSVASGGGSARTSADAGTGSGMDALSPASLALAARVRSSARRSACAAGAETAEMEALTRSQRRRRGGCDLVFAAERAPRRHSVMAAEPKKKGHRYNRSSFDHTDAAEAEAGLGAAACGQWLCEPGGGDGGSGGGGSSSRTSSKRKGSHSERHRKHGSSRRRRTSATVSPAPQ